MATAGRIGMITPSSNTAIEPITQSVCGALLPEVTTHYSRVRVVKNALAADAQQQFTLDLMLQAGSLLADAECDTIVWNGTSAGWLGLDRDRRLCAEIEERHGIRAGSAFLAMIEVMQRNGYERYVLASPYEPAMDEAIADTLRGEGLTCVHSDGLGITRNIELGRLTREQMRDHVLRAVDGRGADAVVIPCTNYAVGWVVDEVERELGIPVVDSVLLAIWEGFRAIGHTDPVEGWGQVLAQQRHPLPEPATSAG